MGKKFAMMMKKAIVLPCAMLMMTSCSQSAAPSGAPAALPSPGVSAGAPFSPDPALQAWQPDEKTKAVLEHELKKSFEFFWGTANDDPASPGYGLIPDRMPSNPDVCSIASVGFGLTGVCIGAERGWITREQGRERALGTLKTLYNNAEQKNGFFFHFLDMKTGKRAWGSEVSIIDTALCLNGVLMAGQYFGGEVQEWADKVYGRVNWPWYVNAGTNRFYMGYTPEEGFFGEWDMTAEQMMLYFLGAGSPTHPVDPMMFYGFGRIQGSYGNLPEMYYSPVGSLFVYQYTHAWYDFQNTADGLGTDWFRNSVVASLANRRFAIDNAGLYGTGPDEWGFTASDGPNGYSGSYGAPPSRGYDNDGTIAPCAAAGSIVFTPEYSARALVRMYEDPELAGTWGLKDAYNKTKEPMWIGGDVIGIDKGIGMLMIENYLTGFVWDTMRRVKAVQTGMQRCRVLPANAHFVDGFEDNYARKGITGAGCVYSIDDASPRSGSKALKVSAQQDATLRFEVNPKKLTAENSASFGFAVKGTGEIGVSFIAADGKALTSAAVEAAGDRWQDVSVQARALLHDGMDKVSAVELSFAGEGVYWLDDVRFFNDTPRIYNVILDGGRTVGSVLKPVWNTWDSRGRPVYIQSIRWYSTDRPTGDAWKLIEGENGPTYTVRPEDAGRFVKCELTGVVADGDEWIVLEPVSGEMTKRLTKE